MSKALRPLLQCSRSRLPPSARHGSRVFSSSFTGYPPAIASCFHKSVWIFGSAFAVSFALAANAGLHLDSAVVSDDVVLDPDTSIAFPTTLHIPSKVPLPSFTLVGVGVRTVSFLGIKVYSIGLYADLGNSNLNFPKTATPEEKIDHIARTTACVLRIIPTRSTSYSHLRDGFMRALLGRLAWCKKQGLLTFEEEQSIQSPLRTFKSMFPTTTLPKHEPLDILITGPSAKPRAVIVRDLGAVQSDWIARELILAYFEGEGLSQKFKQSVFGRLADLGNNSS